MYDFIEELLKVLAPCLLAIDDLELRREFWKC